MARLDLLAQRLAVDLDREEAGPAGDQCITSARLEEFLSGTLNHNSQASVAAHLGGCLICLNNLVILRDCLHGLTAPGQVSPWLEASLAELIGQRKHPRHRTSVLEIILRSFTVRIPVGWAVAMTATAVLVTSVIVPIFHEEMMPSGRDVPFVSPVRPMTELSQRAEKGVPRTVSGVVIQLRDATVGAVEAYLVTLRDSGGAQYSIFVWGPLLVREGDSVQVEGVFQEIRDPSGAVTYKGVATVFRRATPR